MTMMLAVDSWKLDRPGGCTYMCAVGIEIGEQSASLPTNMLGTLLDWCRDQFGVDDTRWHYASCLLQFDRAADALLFVTRWRNTDYAELQQTTWTREAA